MSIPWDEERVARWLQRAEGVEGQLHPVSEVLFAAAALQPGESVLDVGCGTGPTTRDAAEAVGPDGRVTGLDVSGDMLRAAASVDVATPAAIEWLEADPVSWTPPADGWDVVLSRFGVMFFSDPAAAFANLARAARPGGRLAIATWTRRGESPMFEVPLQAALATLGLGPDAAPPDDDGPCSLHDPAAVADLLGGAGWTDVRSDHHRLALRFGGGVDPATAAAASTDFGAARVVTADLGDADLARVVSAITDAFADHVDANGHVVLDGSILITTASKPVR